MINRAKHNITERRGAEETGYSKKGAVLSVYSI